MQRRSLGNHAAVGLESTAFREAGFLGLFTERTGGMSTAPFASLNLSYSSGDKAGNVAANRQQVIDALEIAPFAVGGQVHGSHIVHVGSSRAGSGWDGPDSVIPDTDGLSTKSRQVPLAIATADCVPVLLSSPTEGRVAAIHAGWRGTAAGIVDKAVDLFTEPTNLLAVIGPAARGCCYEVGVDVALSVAAGTAGGAVTEQRGGRTYLDLPRSIAETLRVLGVRQVEDEGSCTIHEQDRFFSHRRDGSPGGRQFAIAQRNG